MTSTPEADQRLIDAHDLALTALREITPASTIGPAAGYLPEVDGSVSLRFQNRLPGYPGWFWTVTVARVDDEEPTVLELELLPGDGALLAPEWVPWAERLAEYRAHQVELAEQAAAGGEVGESADDGEALEDDDIDAAELDAIDDDDDSDDDDDDDELDEDELAAEPRVLHAGDLDGVDIDELDESATDDDEDSEDDDSEDDDDEDFDDDDSDDEDSDDSDDEE